jgi:hypothetical protein
MKEQNKGISNNISLFFTQVRIWELWDCKRSQNKKSQLIFNTKPGKWAVMYLYVTGKSILPFSTNLIFDFELFRQSGIFFLFMLLIAIKRCDICNICKVSHWIWDIGDKPEHDPLNNNNYIYIFRNIKTLNYVLFLLCVCLIYQSWMFVLLMMPHVGPMIRQYNPYISDPV